MTSNDPLADRLAYHDRLPLGWAPLEVLPAPEQLQQMAEQNLRVLAVVSSLEERHLPRGEGDERLEQELERVHQKLDMLLVLFGQFLRRMDPPAPMHPLRLTVAGVSWEAAPPAGSLGLLSLHLHPCMPEAFIWPARLRDGDIARSCALFEPMGEALEAALEKHVFLHHRRSVAGSRPVTARAS
ncbi:MAG TPA: PilZ domain-containing protein [Solimonas sp.]|nr:PilZ domain-containing protein [Solimonas sp.]